MCRDYRPYFYDDADAVLYNDLNGTVYLPPSQAISPNTKATSYKDQTMFLTTDVLFDLLVAAFTADRTAPVETTAAFLDDPLPTRRVTAPATHHLAPVGSVSCTVASASGSAWRSSPVVGVAEIRRRLDVDEL